MGKHHIGTFEELTAYRETALAEVEALTAQRQVLRKDLRRLTRRGNPTGIDEVKQNIRSLSGRLRAARKEVALCEGIAQRSGQVRENLGRLTKQKDLERKEQSKMSYSGDAAEQVVRMSLETGEVAVRLAGSGAKQLAILLYAILREQKRRRVRSA